MAWKDALLGLREVSYFYPLPLQDFPSHVARLGATGGSAPSSGSISYAAWSLGGSMLLCSSLLRLRTVLTRCETESPRDRPYLVGRRAIGFCADYDFGEGARCLRLVPGARGRGGPQLEAARHGNSQGRQWGGQDHGRRRRPGPGYRGARVSVPRWRRWRGQGLRARAIAGGFTVVGRAHNPPTLGRQLELLNLGLSLHCTARIVSGCTCAGIVVVRLVRLRSYRKTAVLNCPRSCWLGGWLRLA